VKAVRSRVEDAIGKYFHATVGRVANAMLISVPSPFNALFRSIGLEK
jgi:hypothetical protein